MTGGPGNQRALDCGSGIGRITKHLLQRHFIKIDLVEQNPKFLVKAKDYLQESGKVGNFFCSGNFLVTRTGLGVTLIGLQSQM